MNYYIMSRGRAGKITTLQWMPERMRAKGRVKIVCGSYEESEYRKIYGDMVIAAPPEVTNYSQKFQWIMQDGMNDGFSRTAIMDDDLVFSKRDPETGSLKTIKDPDNTVDLWIQMDNLLDEFALVGIHPRQMGQNTVPPYAKNGRIICIQGIRRDVCKDIKVDQYPILADVVLNCTLLSRGHANAIITTYFQDHGPCQAPGGCSVYRTQEMQRQACEYLANRWPGYVKLVEKRPKVAKWMGETRIDYTCQWKKLWAAGEAWRRGAGLSPDKEVREDAT